MSDLIDRQAAIATAIKAAVDWHKLANPQYSIAYCIGEAMRQLPPAQPEIIQCKDCKHWIPYDWMFSEIWESRNISDYPEDEIGCNCSDMAMKANDFCSRGERKEVTE